MQEFFFGLEERQAKLKAFYLLKSAKEIRLDFESPKTEVWLDGKVLLMKHSHHFAEKVFEYLSYAIIRNQKIFGRYLCITTDDLPGGQWRFKFELVDSLPTVEKEDDDDSRLQSASAV